MEIRQLRYFIGVANNRSFTRAANELSVAQSALSLQIKQLEGAFGVQLFARHRGGVEITRDGQRFLKHAQSILDAITNAELAMTKSRSAPSGEVRVGISYDVPGILAAEFLDRAETALPLVRLKIAEAMTSHLDEWMNAGQLDLALLYETDFDFQHGRDLVSEDFHLIAHPDNQPFGATISARDLAEFPVALPTSADSARETIDRIAAAHGFKLNIRFEVDSLRTIIGMVSENRACSILTLSAVQNELRDNKVKAIKIVRPVVSRSLFIRERTMTVQRSAVSAARKILSETILDLAKSGKWPTRDNTDSLSNCNLEEWHAHSHTPNLGKNIFSHQNTF